MRVFRETNFAGRCDVERILENGVDGPLARGATHVGTNKQKAPAPTPTKGVAKLTPGGGGIQEGITIVS